MEMAAMYYENRMTADWTYDIASLEHGRLPDSHRCHYLSSRQLIQQWADNSAGVSAISVFVRRMPDRVLSRDDAIDDIGGGVMGFRILRGSDGIAVSGGSVFEETDHLLLTHDFQITQANK